MRISEERQGFKNTGHLKISTKIQRIYFFQLHINSNLGIEIIGRKGRAGRRE